MRPFPASEASALRAATLIFGAEGVSEASYRSFLAASERGAHVAHPHPGDLDHLLLAIIGNAARTLCRHRVEMILDMGRDADLRGAVEVLVVPLNELAVSGPVGEGVIRVLLDVLTQHAVGIAPAVVRAAARATGSDDVRKLLVHHMPPIPTDQRDERLGLVVSFLLGTLEARSPRTAAARPRRPTTMSAEEHLELIIDLCAAALAAS